MLSDDAPFNIEDHPIQTIKDDSISARIVSRCIQEYEADRRFWSPSIETGTDVWKKVMGVIFSPEAMAEMNAKRMIPVEIAEGWPKFLAFMGLGAVSQKNGIVVANYPAEAATPEMVNTALNAIKSQEKVQSLRTGAFGDVAVTGYPQAIWVDKPINILDGQSLRIERGLWSSTIFDPNFLREDYQDASLIHRVMYPRREDLEAMYPDRAKEIKEAFRMAGSDQTAQAVSEYGVTSEDREEILSAIKASQGETSKTGRVHIIERHALIRKPVEVYYLEESDKWQAIFGWDEEKQKEWKAANPGAKPMRVNANVHWVTTFTMNGQLLENRPHWFQEGRFNCEVLVAMMANGRPVGVFEFATTNWTLSAIAKTEEVHSLRLNNGAPTVIQEGTVTNVDQLQDELASPNGRIFTRRGVPANAAIHTLDIKRDNVQWRDLHSETAETNDRLTLDRNVEGGAQSSQEAAKVFGARVAQVKNKFSTVLDNMNDFGLRLDALIVRAWQILTKSHTLIRWSDPETGKTQNAEFNVPQGYNIFSGDPIAVVNRLDLCKYELAFTEVDNSQSGRANELEQFASLMQSIASTPQQFWGTLLSKIPNKIAKEAGEEIKQQEQAAAQNPQKPEPKISITLPADKAFHNPPLIAALKQMGIDVGDAGAQAQGGAPAAGTPVQAPNGGTPQQEGQEK